jgi:sec-independent protein translocase protein TatC
MAALRPVAADARLTLVEHLGELRSRLFACIAVVVVAFALTYWQNHRVLDVVNAPLTNAQLTTTECDKAVDPIRSGECFDRALAQALGSLRPVIADLPTDGPQDRRQAERALESLDRAVRLAPESADRRPVTLGVAEPFFQTVNVALYAAIVLTLPFLLYQLYAFLIPAFTRRERQAILPLLLGVPVLFYVGVLFGYFFALPRAVDFLQNFNASQFDILVQAKDYYKFVLLFLAGTGLVFQVPVVVIAISRLGILTAAQMRKQRGMVAVGAAVISAIITPTPDAVTMLLVMVPFLVLFEVAVALAGLLERRAAAAAAEEEARWEREEAEARTPVTVAVPVVADGPDEPESGGTVAPVDPPPSGGPGPDEPPLADDWVEETWDDEPYGEQPDPRLLGDPEGPRVADAEDAGPLPTGPEPWAPEEPEDDWLARADQLDDEDPFADDSEADSDPEGER